MLRIGSSHDPYCSVEQLISILDQRGLCIEDKHQANFFLGTIGHHRLGPYYRAYSRPDKNFYDGVCLSQIHGLYALERRLRLLILGPLEKLEVSIRSLIINAMGKITSADRSGHPINIFDEIYYNLSSNQKLSYYNYIKISAARETKRKQEYLIREDRIKFTSSVTVNIKPLEQLPAWFIIQHLTFGDLSRMFYILNPAIAAEISSFFELPVSVMRSALHSLTQLRNACAHHDTIFDMRFRKIKFPHKYAGDAKIMGVGDVYESCAMMHIFLSTLSEKSTWYRRLKKLFNEYDCVDITSMGFPENWQTMPFWCVEDVRQIERIKRIRSRDSAQ